MIALLLILVFTNMSFCTFTNVNYYITQKKALLDYYEETYASSQIGCGVICEEDSQCKSINFEKDSGKCQLSASALKDVALNSQHSDTWNIASRSDPLDWVLMFQGVAETGTDVYDAWINGNLVTTHDVNCISNDVTSCTSHYRNPLADLWSTLPIQEVKFAFIRNKDEKAYITFNGVGSDIVSWFDTLRVTGSSWHGINLYNMSPFIFSVEGDAPSRRFCIVPDVYVNCVTDRIVTMILTSGVNSCGYDQQSSYPQFMYSTSSTYGIPETGTDIGFADSIQISVRLS